MKFYYYLYYRFFNFSKSISDDILNEWKPLVIISVLQVFILLEIIIWYSILTKNIYTSPKVYLFLMALAIVSFNYFIFLHNQKWKNYIPVFKLFSRTKRLWHDVLVFLIVFFILGSMIYSFYELSLIDWKNYR